MNGTYKARIRGPAAALKDSPPQGHAVAPLRHDLQSPVTVNLEFAMWDAATEKLAR
jgi:hypothetical protein